MERLRAHVKSMEMQEEDEGNASVAWIHAWHETPRLTREPMNALTYPCLDACKSSVRTVGLI